MRFSTIASILVSAVPVFAQTPQDDAFGWTTDLIRELSEVPGCAVCTSAGHNALHKDAPTKLTFYLEQLLDGYTTTVSVRSSGS